MPEAERGEEVGEVVDLGEVEHLRPHHDPEHELDDHDRDEQVPRPGDGGQVAANAAVATITRNELVSTSSAAAANTDPVIAPTLSRRRG